MASNRSDPEGRKPAGADQPSNGASASVGGTVLMDGVVPLAERIFQVPVRIGGPLECEGLDDTLPGPVCAVAIGLLRYGAAPPDRPQPLTGEMRLLGRVRRRMMGWIREFM